MNSMQNDGELRSKWARVRIRCKKIRIAKYQEELASHTSKKDRLQQIVDKANSLL